MSSSETLPEAETIADPEGSDDAVDVLHLGLCGPNPLSDGPPVPLAGLDELVLARGRSFALQPLAARVARLTIPDPHVSDPHARLLVGRDGIRVEDLKSRNGTFVDGEPATPAELTDGVCLSLGRTSLVLRRHAAEAFAAMPPFADLPGDLSTRSPRLALALRRMIQIAGSALPVFFSGETGTGKEVSARALHAASRRRGAFIAINCGALPENLVESELFGYKRGAFSGALTDRMGLVRAAHQGTLFLDEIAELPVAAQVKLLRVLQQREVVPVGAATPEPVDFRLVTATHQDLAALVAQGKFRTDLWARLRGFEVNLPALRDRREDLGLLTARLLRRHAGDDAAKLRFDRRAVELIALHEWPLNVRELDRVIELAIGLAAPDREIRGEMLAPLLLPPAERRSVRHKRDPEQLEADLRRLLSAHRGNVTVVARELGHTRMQIHRWLKRFGIALGDYRKA